MQTKIRKQTIICNLSINIITLQQNSHK